MVEIRLFDLVHDQIRTEVNQHLLTIIEYLSNVSTSRSILFNFFDEQQQQKRDHFKFHRRANESSEWGLTSCLFDSKIRSILLSLFFIDSNQH